MSTSRDQLARLLALVPYLQGRGEVSVADAARAFGVSEAVIVRDVRLLVMCGLPGLLPGDMIDVDFDALDEQRVIRLYNAEFLTRPLRLDSNEAAALVVALRTLAEGSTPEVRAVVDRARAKVELAAGEGASVAAQVEVHVPTGPAEQTLVRRLEEALAGGRQVRLRHYSPTRDELTERIVDPVAVTTADGHHYLDGWCHRAEDRRLFRVDRIDDAEILDSPAVEHPDLEPLDLAQGIFRPSAEDLTATLRLTARARWVTEYYPVEEVVEEPDGGLTVTLRFGDPTWLVRLLLRLGSAVRRVEPDSLSQETTRLAEETLALYAGTTAYS